jgi:hypothetical protein
MALLGRAMPGEVGAWTSPSASTWHSRDTEADVTGDS